MLISDHKTRFQRRNIFWPTFLDEMTFFSFRRMFISRSASSGSLISYQEIVSYHIYLSFLKQPEGFKSSVLIGDRTCYSYNGPPDKNHNVATQLISL